MLFASLCLSILTAPGTPLPSATTTLPGPLPQETRKNEDPVTQAENMFRLFDSDNSGYLDLKVSCQGCPPRPPYYCYYYCYYC